MAIVRGAIRPEGALVQVVVAPSRFAVESGAANPGRGCQVAALFDTGADITVIRESLAHELGIYPHDRIEVAGLHGDTATCDVYDVDLRFAGADITIPNLTVVAGRTIGPAGVQVIIGRSILWKGVLLYHGIEQTFSFEVPV